MVPTAGPGMLWRQRLERAAYERGKEEGARAAAAQAVTTEMGSGTPYRHVRSPEERGRGRQPFRGASRAGRA